MTTRNPAPKFGDLLKVWRERRRMSQLKLAVEAEISQRHLSFVESGRSQPSRDMVLRLCDYLDVPLRDQNALLLAAGYAPAFAERSLDDPDLAPARAAIDLILKGHMPYPALAVDRHWTMVAANDAVGGLLEGVAAHLLEPPVNVLRLSLHPEGLAPRIANLPVWTAHILERLRRQHALSGDEGIAGLIEEIEGYRVEAGSSDRAVPVDPETNVVLVPMVLQTDQGLLSFFSTTTVFGTAVEVTLSELILEAFYPADEETRNRLHARA